jgi:broad specificity phosphatase PhoE
VILLLRHSIADRTPGDPGLSDEGRVLADHAAAALGGEPIRIFASPLRRALETAQIIGARLGSAVTVDARLRERDNWGDVPDESREEFVARWERCDADRDLVPPQGRSSRQAGADLGAFVDEVGERERGPVLAVSHGGIIVDFLLEHFEPEELERRAPHYRDMSYCALTVIDPTNGYYELVRLATPVDGADWQKR